MGVAQNERARVTHVSVFVSIQGAQKWVPLFEPQPFLYTVLGSTMFVPAFDDSFRGKATELREQSLRLCGRHPWLPGQAGARGSRTSDLTSRFWAVLGRENKGEVGLIFQGRGRVALFRIKLMVPQNSSHGFCSYGGDAPLVAGIHSVAF